MPTISKTSDIKSATLLPETAGLAKISPRKEDKREDEVTGKVTEINSDYLFKVSDFTEDITGLSGVTSSGIDFGIELVPNHIGIIISKDESRDGFIGSISDEEAVKMEEGVLSFKKRFDDDLARRNKILFGE